MKRRTFLAASSLAALHAASGPLGCQMTKRRVLKSGEAVPKQKMKSGIQYIRADVPEYEIPKYKGEYYYRRIPDTLDLAERARITVEGVITQQTDPEHDYE